MGTDSYMESKTTASWWRRDWAKKEKGPMDMDNSVVIVGGRGIRGLNGNGKIKIKIKKLLGQNSHVLHTSWHMHMYVN